jgi:hypothetical protein
MEDEVKEAMYTALSVIVISAIIVAAVVFSNLSYKAYNIKLRTDSINYNIQLKSELYNYFVNPNNDLSGVDIIDFITIHDRAFKYIISTSGNTYKLSNKGLTTISLSGIETTKDAEDSFWTQTYLTENILKSDLYSNFDGCIVDSNGTVIEDVTEIGGDVWLQFNISSTK